MEILIKHSEAREYTKEEVQQSDKKYWIPLEEHEKLHREKETWKKEFQKNINRSD